MHNDCRLNLFSLFACIFRMLSVQIIKSKTLLCLFQRAGYKQVSAVRTAPSAQCLILWMKGGPFPKECFPVSLCWAALPPPPCVTQLMQSGTENGSVYFLFLTLYFQCSNELKNLHVLRFQHLIYCILVVKTF